MTWKDIVLYGLTDGEEDELGNPAQEQTEIWSGQGRFTPWTLAEIEVNGREVTETEQRYIIPVSYATAKATERFTVNGVTFDITSITDMSPRWVMLQGRAYGDTHNRS